MSPSPLGSHNHSQTHLKLLERLPLRALVSADLHTEKSLKTLWNLDLSLSRITRHAKLQLSAQTPLRKSDFRLKYVALFMLMRLAQF
ncbi:hypothetical protein GmHk_02G004696 [Glycine max]|nr:hypothetical protein GmHk_02G004696 [Glycine max]